MAESVARATNAGHTSARTRIGLLAYVRLTICTLALGVVLGGLAVVGIGSVVGDSLDGIDAPYDSDARKTRDLVILVSMGTAFTLILVVPWICLAVRAGRRTRVSWDRDGVTEWEGDVVRTFIPRAGMRIAIEETRRTRRTRGRSYLSTVRQVVQVSDADGRVITLAWHSPLRTLLGWLPLWMRRRAVLAGWKDVEAFAEAMGKSTEGASLVVDPRAARRPLAWLSHVTHLGALALGGFVIWTLQVRNAANDAVGLALLGAGGCLLLAMLRPAGELRALFREGRRLAGAERVRIRAGGAEGTELVGPGDRVVHVDGRSIVHADARLMQRDGEVWAVIEQAKGGGAYRDTGRAKLTAVETVAERAERRRWLVAAFIELAARQVHAALVFVLGILVVTGVQRF